MLPSASNGRAHGHLERAREAATAVAIARREGVCRTRTIPAMTEDGSVASRWATSWMRQPRRSRTHDATQAPALGAIAGGGSLDAAHMSRAVRKAVSRNGDIGRSLVGTRGKNPAWVTAGTERRAVIVSADWLAPLPAVTVPLAW